MRIIKFHDLLLLLALHFFAHNLTAQPITWKEVAPVFYTHCGTCHRPGGIGPFNILDYSIASAYARGIKFVVERREMPPWPADPTYRHYHQERVLSAGEINAIVSWADQGAPSGDFSHAPPGKPSKIKGSGLFCVRSVPSYSIASRPKLGA